MRGPDAVDAPRPRSGGRGPTLRAITDAATRLFEAGQTGSPCEPVRDLLPPDDVDAAYAVQQANVRRLLSESGWRVCGRKIGLTSPVVQAQLGVNQPDFGALFVELSHGDGEEVPTESLLQPRVEAEVALILGADLDLGRHSVADVIRATAFALPALEIVDSRIRDWDIRFVDTVADNASAGRFVLGTVPVPLEQVDLAEVQMSMSVDGAVASAGAGSACLGNPLFAARWLADTLCAMGTPLRAGDVVLTGALGPMVPVRPGAQVEATITGLGRVRCRFSTKDDT
jgi:2-keto-4-pentenoate hydratase